LISPRSKRHAGVEVSEGVRRIRGPSVMLRCCARGRAHPIISNLIEGHKTLPRDIERAMKQDFSRDETQHNNQELSLAHIAVEKLMEERLEAQPVDIYSSDFLCWLHREFYTRLPEPLRWATTKTGKRYRIQPGQL